MGLSPSAAESNPSSPLSAPVTGAQAMSNLTSPLIPPELTPELSSLRVWSLIGHSPDASLDAQFLPASILSRTPSLDAAHRHAHTPLTLWEVHNDSHGMPADTRFIWSFSLSFDKSDPQIRADLADLRFHADSPPVSVVCLWVNDQHTCVSLSVTRDCSALDLMDEPFTMGITRVRNGDAIAQSNQYFSRAGSLITFRTGYAISAAQRIRSLSVLVVWNSVFRDHSVGVLTSHLSAMFPLRDENDALKLAAKLRAKAAALRSHQTSLNHTAMELRRQKQRLEEETDYLTEQASRVTQARSELYAAWDAAEVERQSLQNTLQRMDQERTALQSTNEDLVDQQTSQDEAKLRLNQHIRESDRQQRTFKLLTRALIAVSIVLGLLMLFLIFLATRNRKLTRKIRDLEDLVHQVELLPMPDAF